MTTPDGLTAEAESLVRALMPWLMVPSASNERKLRRWLADIEAAVLARHVRETGCDGLTVERLAEALSSAGMWTDEETHESITHGSVEDVAARILAALASPATEEDTCRPAVLPHHWPAARVRQDESGDMTTETYCWRCGVALASPEAGLLLGLDEAG